MRLFYSTTSPYARKVLVTALEKGLGERLTLVTVNAYAQDPALLAVNPLSRIPTLETDEGAVIYDSPVICEWLDTQAGEPRLVPPEGPGRWAVLRGQALADGIMDDAVANVMEGRRPPGQQDPQVMAARTAAVLRAAAALDADLPGLPEGLTLAHVAAGCALGYLDFRLPELDWRGGNTRLTAWYGAFAARPSMRSTRPGTPTA